jgi:DNA-binding HxlR family transcriptional regulator
MNLSPQQRQTLSWLLDNTRRIEEIAPDLKNAGIDYRLDVADKSRENCRRASFSRTLSRLEHRGLITRHKGEKGRRTIRVALTPQGRRVAEAITASF